MQDADAFIGEQRTSPTIPGPARVHLGCRSTRTGRARVERLTAISLAASAKPPRVRPAGGCCARRSADGMGLNGWNRWGFALVLRHKRFHSLERNAVTRVTPIPGVHDAPFLVDQEVGRQEIVGIQPRQPDDTQAPEQRRSAHDHGLELSPERALDAISIVCGGGGVGNNDERTRLARREALDALRRGGKHRNDLQTLPRELFMAIGQFVDPEIAERATRITKEAQQGTTARGTADHGDLPVDVRERQLRRNGGRLQSHPSPSLQARRESSRPWRSGPTRVVMARVTQPARTAAPQAVAGNATRARSHLAAMAANTDSLALRRTPPAAGICARLPFRPPPRW